MSASPTVFILQSRKLQGRRFDSEYHYALLNIRIKSPYPLVKLFSLATFKTGGTPSTDNEEYWGGTLPWVSAKDFKNFRFEDAEDHITELAAQEATTYVVNKPAVLMVSRSGILQHSLPVMVTHKRTAINQDIKAFFPDKRVSADYLGAFFDLSGKRLLPLLCKSGATVQSLNTNELLNLPIPVPPHEVQKQIVAELDAAYEAKRNADEKATRLLASIDEVIFSELGIPPLPPQDTSIRARMFFVTSREVAGNRLDAYCYHPFFALNEKRIRSLPSCQLGELVTLSHETWTPGKWNGTEAGTFPYIEIGAISTDTGTVTAVEDIAIANAPSRARMIVRKGDLLISLTRPTRRALAFVPRGYETLVASTGFAVIRNHNPAIDRQYLFEILRSKLCVLQFDQRSSGGNYPAITEEQLLRCLIPVPEHQVQSRIVKQATSLREEAKRLKSEATQALASAKSRMVNQLL